MVPEAEVTPNLYTVLTSLIATMGPILATLVTYKLTTRQNVRIETKADEAAHKAEQAAAESIAGNERLESVHKVINGRTDKLLQDKRELRKQLEAANKELVALKLKLKAKK